MTAVVPVFLPIRWLVDVLQVDFLVQPIDSAVQLARLQKRLFPIAVATVSRPKSSAIAKK
jgi:hypothetical protein